MPESHPAAVNASEPRTISGRAWLSGMRPHHRRAAMPLILSIEREAAKPAVEALGVVAGVIEDLIALDPANANPDALRELIERARAARAEAESLLAD